MAETTPIGEEVLVSSVEPKEIDLDDKVRLFSEFIESKPHKLFDNLNYLILRVPSATSKEERPLQIRFLYIFSKLNFKYAETLAERFNNPHRDTQNSRLSTANIRNYLDIILPFYIASYQDNPDNPVITEGIIRALGLLNIDRMKYRLKDYLEGGYSKPDDEILRDEQFLKILRIDDSETFEELQYLRALEVSLFNNNNLSKLTEDVNRRLGLDNRIIGKSKRHFYPDTFEGSPSEVSYQQAIQKLGNHEVVNSLRRLEGLFDQGLSEEDLRNEEILRAYFNKISNLSQEDSQLLAELIHDKGKLQSEEILSLSEYLDYLKTMPELVNLFGNFPQEFKRNILKFVIQNDDEFSSEDIKKIIDTLKTNEDISLTRLKFLTEKFGGSSIKLVLSRLFSVDRDSVPIITDERFYRGITDLNSEELNYVKDLLEKVNGGNHNFFDKFIRVYFTEHGEFITLEKYLEGLTLDQRALFRSTNPEIYNIYKIYRYLRLSKMVYNTSSYEQLKEKFAEDKNQVGIFAVDFFTKLNNTLDPLAFFSDKEEPSIKSNLSDENQALPIHIEGWGNPSRINKQESIDIPKLEKMISDEVAAVIQAVDKVNEIKKGKVVMVVPNQRLAWIYEDLIPDFSQDISVFKSPRDRAIFDLEVSLKEQETKIDPNFPSISERYWGNELAILLTAQEWLKQGKIPQFVYKIAGFKIESSKDGGGQRNFVDNFLKESELSNLTVARVVRNIPDLELVFIDGRKEDHFDSKTPLTNALINIRSIMGRYPNPERAHYLSLPSPRDDITELLGESLSSAIYYALVREHPLTRNEAGYIKTKEGEIYPGYYYIQRLKEIMRRTGQDKTKEEIIKFVDDINQLTVERKRKPFWKNILRYFKKGA